MKRMKFHPLNVQKTRFPFLYMLKESQQFFPKRFFDKLKYTNLICYWSVTDYCGMRLSLMSKIDQDKNAKIKLKEAKWACLHKFCFDKMIELEVAERVANFIQGRVPRRIVAKHYLALARQARSIILSSWIILRKIYDESKLKVVSYIFV